MTASPDRLPLAGNSIHRYVSTDGATKEDGEPDVTDAGGIGSVWWTWTAPASAHYRITFGSGAPFAVYTGNTLATLREVISNRDTWGSVRPPPRFSWPSPGSATRSRSIQTTTSQRAPISPWSSSPRIPRTLLRVSTTVGGTVTPGFLGTSFRPLGANCAITARAVPGYLFSGWTGSITSAEPRLTFRMQTGLSLVANFVPSPFVGSTGSYMGLITSNTENPANSTTGLFKINLTVGGAFSGTVTYNNGTFPFHGVFGPDGTFTGTSCGRINGRSPSPWVLTSPSFPQL